MSNFIIKTQIGLMKEEKKQLVEEMHRPHFFQMEKENMFKVYLQLDRVIYESGTNVHGCVYLGVLTTSNYSKLEIGIRGIEHSRWTVRVTTGGNRNSAETLQNYDRMIKNYESSFKLHDFHGEEIPPGNYAFPFTFKLPEFLPGSTYESANCYIRYDLLLRITNPKTGHNKIESRALNIMQPARSKLDTTSIARTIHSKCCGCFSDYGETTVILKCNKSLLRSGQHFQISGLVDNSRGRTKIRSGRIKFEEIIFMVAEDTTRKQVINHKTLYALNRSIEPKEIYPFKFTDKISSKLKTYTAIGLAVARVFVIRLETESGCCSESAGATLHVIVQSKFPQVISTSTSSVPKNFCPQQFPCVVCESMKPFRLDPKTLIPYYNLPVNKKQIILPQKFLYLTYLDHDLDKEIQSPDSKGKGKRKLKQQKKGIPPYFEGQQKNAQSNSNLVRNLYV